MNQHADELQTAAHLWRSWAKVGGVTLTASTLAQYAVMMDDAASAIMRMQWELHGGPPKRQPIPVHLSRDVMRQRLQVIAGGRGP